MNNPSLGITNPVFKGTQLENLFLLGKTWYFSSLLTKLVSLVLIIGSIYFFFMLLTGAISWIGSGGDKGSLETAKSKITNALIGIVILFGTFAIAKLVETFFGISILTLDIGSLVIQ